ncbi:MAG: hypothetical protein U0103_20355 [Candidatus Obscuribacterales bacterium]|nr:hypothetical protein [Cyanobacteria bacterium SZAS LIN-5]
MKLLRSLSILGILGLTFFSGSAVCAAPPVNGWRLLQISDEQGVLETTLTKDAIRIDTEDCTLLIMPPDYDMYLFNPKNKRYLQLPMEAFSMHTSRRKETAAKYTIKKGGDFDICGVKANKYEVANKKGRQTFEFWATKAFPVPARLSDACAIFMSFSEMPPGYGLPLRAARINENGGRFTHIRTKSIERAYVPPQTFAKPKNFLRVANFVSLRTNGMNVPSPSPDALDYMREPEDKKAKPK